MNSGAPYIRNSGHRAPSQIVLNVEVPLLHVWPSSFTGKRNKTQRSRASAEKTRIKIVVPGDIYHTGGLSVDIVLYSNDSVLASLPLVCSKKIPYPPRIAHFPSPFGSKAKPMRGAGFHQ